jgi:Predicted membrane protein (DUF2306)
MPRLAKAALALGTLLLLPVVWLMYVGRPLGSAVTPDMALVFQAHWIGISTHIIASAIALTLAPVQVSTRVRRRWPVAHAWMGRTYLGLGVLPGGLAGLYMGALSARGWIARAGFMCLAVCWLYSGAMAYRTIRRGDVAAHRRWILRNVSLTAGAIMLRIYMPLFGLLGVPFETAYPIVSWVSWLPNLLLMEWWLRRSSPHAPAERAMAPRSMRSTAAT